MAGFLDDMAAASRVRAGQAMAQKPLAKLRARCADLPAPPPLRRAGGFDLIAELKLRSPSQGELVGARPDIGRRVVAYAESGAAAVSVLTEPQHFAGSLDDLRDAAAALALIAVPVMRKDFLVDPYQLYEARAAGAGGALLIVRMLSPSQLGEMLDCAFELELFTLLEAFDEADLEVATGFITRHAASGTRGRDPVGPPLRSLQSKSLAPGGRDHLARASGEAVPATRRVRGGVGAPERSVNSRSEGAPRRIPDASRPRSGPRDEMSREWLFVGVNSRDLQTLEVVPDRLAALAPRLPRGCPRVAESGLATPEDAARVALAGYDMALVGSALMRAPDPGALLAAMLAAGRAVVQ